MQLHHGCASPVPKVHEQSAAADDDSNGEDDRCEETGPCRGRSSFSSRRRRRRRAAGDCRRGEQESLAGHLLLVVEARGSASHGCQTGALTHHSGRE